MEATYKPTPLKSRIPIQVFSAFNIVLGIVSISLQIAAIILFADKMYYNEYDYVGTGIWAGMFYITSGGLGIGASKKPTRGMLIATTVLSAISLASSIVAVTLTILGGVSYHSCYSYYNYYCYGWLYVEWTLMGFSTLSFINNTVLLSLVSIPTCCGGQNKDFQHAVIMQQPQMIMVNGQPMYVVPPPPTGMMMQHQQPIMESSYPIQLQPQYLQNFTLNNSSNQPSNNFVPSSSLMSVMSAELNQQKPPVDNHSALNNEPVVQEENKY